jgi:hypothetical protein
MVIVLALLPASGTIEVGLAWSYVGSRVVHSLFQATINKIEVRFALFVLSSLILLALVIRAAMLLLL